jgi:hypothetical protein
MLRLTTTRPGSRQCDGTARRDFMTIGALGTTGLLLPDLWRARAAAPSQPGSSTKHTSVVWLWLGGGPTHIETFDPKPNAPAEFRSTVGHIDTKVPGVQIGSVFPEIAGQADKFAFVRSFAHRNSGHGGGTHWVMTGHDFPPADNGQQATKPGIGSILARHRGANNVRTGLPTYVRTSNILGDGAVWLGPAYSPFDLAGKARQNMNLALPLDRLNDRRELLKGFDTLNRDVDAKGLAKGLDSLENQAFDLILSQARERFDITKEDAKTRECYGKGLGEQMLLARRLVEGGVGFVTLSYGGWDMHGNVADSIKKRAPMLDHAVSTFVSDLAERGMSDNVLLVITGEFGRTPRINKTAGRDHWAPLSTLALAGGGLQMGRTVGESTDKAETPKSKPLSPQDLMATVFHVLGIPQDLHYQDPTGRPMPMVNGGVPIAELI